MRLAMLAGLAVFGNLLPEARSQEEGSAGSSPFAEEIKKIKWQQEGTGTLRNRATISIPPGYVFTGADGAARLMELYGNPSSGHEQGLIAPEDLSWCVLFEFNDTGYVKDDEKDQLDAAKLLSQLRAGQEQANKQRASAGMEELEITGWAKEPYYNESSNNLEWALVIASPTGKSVNLNTKILGRKGVMQSILICDPGQLDSLMEEYQQLLTGYEFLDGQRYADFRSGDKIAQVGLTGLIVGGGAVAAWKFGGKFIKVIVVALAAAGAAIAKFFGQLFGGKRRE